MPDAITTCASFRDAEDLANALDGFVVARIDGRAITDKESFIRAVAQVLPTDPEMSGGRSFDALYDSITNGLVDRETVLVYSGASVFRKSAPSEYATAMKLLQDVADYLALPDLDGTGHRGVFRVFVSG